MGVALGAITYNCKGFITQKTRPIVVSFNHEKKGNLRYLNAANSVFDQVTYTNSAADLPDPYDNLEVTVVAGDSSNPVFIIIDKEAVLLASFHNTSTSPAYSEYISDINTLISSADTAASVTTNFTLTEFNLDKFDFLNF